jgi:hypothetical protein
MNDVSWICHSLHSWHKCWSKFVELVLTTAAMDFCKNRESSMFFLACGSFINTPSSFEGVKALAEQ